MRSLSVYELTSAWANAVLYCYARRAPPAHEIVDCDFSRTTTRVRIGVCSLQTTDYIPGLGPNLALNSSKFDWTNCRTLSQPKSSI